MASIYIKLPEDFSTPIYWNNRMPRDPKLIAVIRLHCCERTAFHAQALLAPVDPGAVLGAFFFQSHSQKKQRMIHQPFTQILIWYINVYHMSFQNIDK